MRLLPRMLCAGALAGLTCHGPATAQSTPDPHILFETRCMSCHGHAGTFARTYLTLESNIPVTSRGMPVGTFLRTHRGGVPDEAIAPLLDMFRQQLTSGAIYESRCLFCHDRARDFARLSLIFEDGRLFGRYSGHDIAAFLPGHARLGSDEARQMLEILGGFLDEPE